jgi:type II secretory pathway pseudopilin PulG
MTILELAVVLIIVLILASMLLPLYTSYQGRMEETRCLANLKSLYVGASGYLLQNKSWPQIPNKLIIDDPKTYAKSWVATLAPHGIAHSSWICPTVQSKLQLPMDAISKDEHYRVDYIAAAFDEDENSPRRDPKFPWFVEKAGFHARGNVIILADGTTTALSDVALQAN